MNSQEIAFDKFSKLKVGALFMKMGTGKTKVALDLVKYNNVDFLLYVTPYSTKDNIQKEIDLWGINCDYEIVGYETIQSSAKEFLRLYKKMENKKCFIIADESIFIKNEETKRFSRLVDLRRKCDYALILNGTPITKNEWDLYNQMYFLSPLIINMNRTQFLNVFFKQITYKKIGEKQHTFYKFSEVNAKELKKMISPYVFECDLIFDKDVKVNKYIINCDKTAYVKEKERRLEEYMKYKKSETIINMLNSLNKISANMESKNNALINYIRKGKVIVYCNYLSEVDYIRRKCDCFVITGETPRQERVKIIEEFKNSKNKPLIMTFGVGSYSLNLQYCNEIVFSSLNFDFAKIEQSRYRIKRMNQKCDITYTYFLTPFKINDLIFDNLEKKESLSNIIKEKIKEGEEEKWLKNL